MENEVPRGRKSPLYGRRTGQLKLEGLPPPPFKFSEWPVRGPLQDMPRHIRGTSLHTWSLIEHQVKLQEMLTATALFLLQGSFYNEVFFILQQELRNLPGYNSVVLRALAEGKTSIRGDCDQCPAARTRDVPPALSNNPHGRLG